MSEEDHGLDQRRRGGHRPWREGPWPVLLVTAVAVTGPALFLLFPSQLMFWVGWLFLAPLVVFWVYLDRKADEEGNGATGDAAPPAHPDIWGPPSGL